MSNIDRKALRTSFNKAANTYNDYNFLQKHVGEELIQRLEFINFKPKAILEVGCGTGFCTNLLKKIFPEAKIVAIDIAENMLFHAKKSIYQPASSQQVRDARLDSTIQNQPLFICADTHTLPFQNFTFDLIFSNLTLQWVMNLNKLFFQWLEVIKPAGGIIFSSLGPTTLQELRLSWGGVDQHTHTNEFSDILSIGNDLTKAHWENPVLDMDEIVLEYADIHQIFIDLKMIGAHNMTVDRPHGLMSKNKWQKFMANYKNNFFKHDKYQLTYQVIYAHAFSPMILEKVMKFKKINIPIEG